MTDLASAWNLVHTRRFARDPVEQARMNNERREAVALIASVATALPRIVYPLAPPRDWGKR